MSEGKAVCDWSDGATIAGRGNMQMPAQPSGAKRAGATVGNLSCCQSGAGTLYLCPTPIGNLQDITLRVLDTLRAVDLIACEDTRQTIKLLNHFAIEKPLLSYYEHNKAQRGEKLLDHLLKGKDVALVSDAGTPVISDPGSELVALCAEHGVRVVPLPGPCAAITALTASALPAGRFCFEGFLTVNRKNRMRHLNELERETRTMIFYEAPHKLPGTLRDMLEVFGDREVVLCRELTKKFEEVRRTTLSQALAEAEERPPKGEFVVLVRGREEQAEAELFEGVSVFDHYMRYLNAGVEQKEAVKRVALDRGVPKREIYDALFKK